MATQRTDTQALWARLQVPAVAHDRIDLIVALHRARRGAQVLGGRRRGARPPGKALAQHRCAQEGARVQAAGEQQRRVQLAPDALRTRRPGNFNQGLRRARNSTSMLSLHPAQ